MCAIARRKLLSEVLVQAYLCHAVYAGREAVKGVARYLGAACRFFSIEHCKAAALIFPDHAYLSVCGTDDDRDRIQNRSANQIQYLGKHTCHEGFAEAADLLMEDFSRPPKFWDDLARRWLVIGGHSAGGAIAQALSVHRELTPRHSVGFGTPRIWAPATAADYAMQPWNKSYFTHGLDPVPRLPLKTFRLLFNRAKYAHAVPPSRISPDGIQTEKPGSAFANWLTAVWDYWLWRPWQAIADHSMSAYLSCVEAICRREGVTV